MKVYIMEFSYFDSVEWKCQTKKIMARTEEQLMITFYDETKYIHESSYYGEEPKTRRELQDDLWKEVHEEQSELVFPIVKTVKDNYSL